MEYFDNLTNQTHLLTQDVRRCLPVRLVTVEGDVAKRRFWTIEDDGEMVGTLVAQEVDQHRGEPIDRVGDLA
jgi:hypothetical protein